MAVTVPSTDVVSYNLQAQVTAVQALVNAPTINPQNLLANTQLLFQLQQQLVENLMGSTNERGSYGAPGTSSNSVPSFLNPATILSTCTINT